jgi:hypothetical protein
MSCGFVVFAGQVDPLTNAAILTDHVSLIFPQRVRSDEQ